MEKQRGGWRVSAGMKTNWRILGKRNAFRQCYSVRGSGGSRARRGWSTFPQLCGGTPRLLWCRYPEATQICVSPWAALFAAPPATEVGDKNRNFVMLSVFYGSRQVTTRRVLFTLENFTSAHNAGGQKDDCFTNRLLNKWRWRCRWLIQRHSKGKNDAEKPLWNNWNPLWRENRCHSNWQWHFRFQDLTKNTLKHFPHKEQNATVLCF